MDKIYHAALKALLGVRTTTVNDLCLAELGYPLLKYYVLQRQRWFFKKMIDSRSGLGDDPLMLAINLAQDSGSKAGIPPGKSDASGGIGPRRIVTSTLGFSVRCRPASDFPAGIPALVHSGLG